MSVAATQARTTFSMYDHNAVSCSDVWVSDGWMCSAHACSTRRAAAMTSSSDFAMLGPPCSQLPAARHQHSSALKQALVPVPGIARGTDVFRWLRYAGAQLYAPVTRVSRRQAAMSAAMGQAAL